MTTILRYKIYSGWWWGWASEVVPTATMPKWVEI